MERPPAGFTARATTRRLAWCRATLVCAGIAPCAVPVAHAESPTTAEIFSRPVVSRAYEQDQWVLRNADGLGLAETASSVGAALAGLAPSYVSGLIYLEDSTPVSAAMVADYALIRSDVRAANTNAKFDVEISLNPAPPAPKQPFSSASALVAKMEEVDRALHPDGWWFDFYSTAEKVHPDWIEAAAAYAHAHGQTIGGNVFDDTVPPHSDAVAFVDKPVAGSLFGFDFDRAEIAALHRSSPATVIVGHLQSNPQNGPDTESCVYIHDWSIEERALYLLYWKLEQGPQDFTFMYPVFYPLCPGAVAYDPLTDTAANGVTFYDYLKVLVAAPNPAPAASPEGGTTP